MNKLRERAMAEARAVLGDEASPEMLDRATMIWLYGCMFGASIPKVVHVAHTCPTEVDAEHADLCPECASEHEIYAIAQHQAQMLALRSSAMPPNIRLATAVTMLEGMLAVKPVDCETATQVVEAVQDVLSTNVFDVRRILDLIEEIWEASDSDAVTRRLLDVLKDSQGKGARRLEYLTYTMRLSLKMEAGAGTFYSCCACGHRWEMWEYAAGVEVACPKCKTQLSVRTRNALKARGGSK